MRSIYYVDDYNVYVAGAWTVWKYNGFTWTMIGLGNAGGTVVSLHSYDNGQTLFAFGRFTLMNDVACNYVAKYDGSTWSAFGSGLGDPFDYGAMITVNANNIFIGGQRLSGQPPGSNLNFRKYDSATNTWTPLIGNVGEIFSLSYYNSIIYLTGGSGYIWRYYINTGSYDQMGAGLGNRIFGIYALNNNNVYVTGWIGAYSWNGSSWVNMGSFGNGNTITAFDANNVFGGAAGGTSPFLFKWNGSNSWSGFQGGRSAVVYAIIPTGANAVYVGGDFGISLYK